jgi:hypothetical protein
MPWLIILLIFFAGLHFLLLLPVQIAIASAAVLTILLWLAWKLKWVILGIIGLEEIFGDRGDSV